MKNGKLLLTLFATLVVFFMFSSCREQGTNPDGFISISGKVINIDGIMLSGVKIEIVNAQDNVLSSNTTLENGIFNFSNIPTNLESIFIIASKEGYKPQKLSIKSLLENALDNKIVIVMEQEKLEDCCGNIHFTIFDKANDTPLNEVEVKLMQDGNLISKAYSTKEGKVDFEKLCPGAYWVRIYKNGYEVIEKEVTVANCDPINIKLPMVKNSDEPCCGEINIMVFDKETKNGIPEAKVTLNLGEKVIETKYTDARGVVGFNALCMGTYWIKIERKGYASITENIKVINCDPINVTFGMEKATEPCCGKIYLKLYDKADEKRLPGREVLLYLGNVLISKQFTNDNGEVNFVELCPGTYIVKVKPEGYKPVYQEVKVVNCDPVPVSIGVEKVENPCCGKIIVTAYDKETQKIIQGAEVRLNFGEKLVAKKITNEKGIAEFYELCMGKYWLRIYIAGYKVIEQEVNVENCDPINITALLEKTTDNPCCGKININLLDNLTKKPIVGAEVKLTSTDGKVIILKTNEEGNVAFTDLCMGKYYIRIAAEGYKVYEKVLEVVNCDPIQLNLTLEPAKECCKGVLQVTVLDESTQKPIPNAIVKIWLNGQIVKYAKTNEYGIAVMDGICEGEYGVSITIDGYKGIEYKYKHPCNETIKETKTLIKSEDKPCCNGVLYVKVIDQANNNAVANATVSMWKDGKIIQSLTTNAEGYAIFKGICEGEYAISINREGYKEFEYKYNHPCNETIKETKAITKLNDNPCCKGILQVTVLDDATKKPIAGALVKLWLNGKLLKYAKTGDNGIATIDGICEGEYGVSVTIDGYKGVEYKYTHPCNETIKETKYLVKNEDNPCCKGVLKITVLDKETQKPVANGLVKLLQAGLLVKSTKTNSNGEAVIDGICEGDYTVYIGAEAYYATDYTYNHPCNKEISETKTILKKEVPPCTGKLKLQYKDSVTQKPVSNTEVKLYLNGEKVGATVTNTEGYAVFEALCTGKHVAVATHEGYATKEANYSIISGQTTTDVLELIPVK